eukprot:Lankesteria_metandrocarpae@DN5354_c2_g1_i1.p1
MDAISSNTLNDCELLSTLSRCWSSSTNTNADFAMTAVLDNIHSTGHNGSGTTAAYDSLLLQAVDSLKPSLLAKALQLLDSNKILCDTGGTFMTAVPSSIVPGDNQGMVSDGHHYVILPTFCSCLYFAEEVIKKRSSYFCKHLFAARLLLLMQKMEVAPTKCITSTRTSAATNSTANTAADGSTDSTCARNGGDTNSSTCSLQPVALVQ